MSETHVFQHEAMKTTFTLRFICDDPQLARNAARDCVETIDTIENTLSRYIEGSDIWQVNQMNADEMRFLTEHSYNCLKTALEVYAESKGLFDITLGRQIEHQKNQVNSPVPAPAGQLMLDPNRPAIHCMEAGREVDLGGIGKGYALDQIKILATEWGIESALLSAGASTQLAYGITSWPITLQGSHSTLQIDLNNQSLSVSGTGIQGSHIVSPNSKPDYTHERIWLCATSAAKADAYSTAAILMPADEIKELSQYLNDIYIETVTGIESIHTGTV